GWPRRADGPLALGLPTESMAWFPSNHHPSDKATYRLTLTVPQELRAVSNGEPDGEETRDGRRVQRWCVREPMASYLAVVAVGRYETHRTRPARGLPGHTGGDPDARAAGRRA